MSPATQEIDDELSRAARQPVVSGAQTSGRKSRKV
jgi:hypothetical protein